ncbi:GNAT family N-acetyltransferase [Rhodococcus opacus]|uniref:GNAT family N-acetyltransferase n=1 Tax=Rhodococcus opacus TaxID=37919 RepID=UPI0030CA5A2C
MFTTVPSSSARLEPRTVAVTTHRPWRVLRRRTVSVISPWCAAVQAARCSLRFLAPTSAYSTSLPGRNRKSRACTCTSKSTTCPARPCTDCWPSTWRTCAPTSPPDSVHALDLPGLRDPSVTVWTLWDEETVLGTVALRELSPAEGEIKSMRTATEARGRGVAGRLLAHLVDEARARGYVRLNLETGTEDFFARPGVCTRSTVSPD